MSVIGISFAPFTTTTSRAVVNFDPDQPRAPVGSPEGGQWIKEGTTGAIGATTTVAPTAAPKPLGPIAREMAKRAEQVPFSTETIDPDHPSVSRHDYDAIENEMTQRELDQLEEHLANARSDYIDSAMENWEPNIDERELADQEGYGLEDIHHDLGNLIDQHGGTEVARLREELSNWHNNANPYYDHGSQAIAQASDSLTNVPKPLQDAINSYESKAEDKLQEVREREEQHQRDSAEEDLGSNYDDYADRAGYLTHFYYENPERFTGPDDIPRNTWFQDPNGNYHFKFSTDADRYGITVFDRSIADAPAQELQFSSETKGNAFGVTGAGHAHEVFAAVVPAVVAYMKHEQPNILTFSAAEKSRQKLYDRLVKSVTTVDPAYSALAIDEGGEHPHRYYAVVKRDVRDNLIKQIKERSDHVARFGYGLPLKEPKILINTRISAAGIDPVWFMPEGWLTVNEEEKVMMPAVNVIGLVVNDGGRGFFGHAGRPGQRGGSTARGSTARGAAPPPASSKTETPATTVAGSSAPGTSAIGAAVSAAATSHVHEAAQKGHTTGHGHADHAGHAPLGTHLAEMGHEMNHLHAAVSEGQAMLKEGAFGKFGQRLLGGSAGETEQAVHGHETVAGHGAERGVGHVAEGHEGAAGAEGGHEGGGLFSKLSLLAGVGGAILGGKIGAGLEKSLGLDKAQQRLYETMRTEHGEEEARLLHGMAYVGSLMTRVALGGVLAHYHMFGAAGKTILGLGGAAAALAGKSRSTGTKLGKAGAMALMTKGALGSFGEEIAHHVTVGLAESVTYGVPGVGYLSLLASHYLGKALDKSGISSMKMFTHSGHLQKQLRESKLGEKASRLAHAVGEHIENITNLQPLKELGLIGEQLKQTPLKPAVEKVERGVAATKRGAATAIGRVGAAALHGAEHVAAKMRLRALTPHEELEKWQQSTRAGVAANVLGYFALNAEFAPTAPIKDERLDVNNPSIQPAIRVMRMILKTLLSTPQGRELWQEINTPQGAAIVLQLLSQHQNKPRLGLAA